MSALEAALERVSPEASLAVSANCPECGVGNAVAIDPYLLLTDDSGEILLDEIHTIASAYHWPEAEILALPRTRRRRYIQRIDRARGMVT